LLIQIDSCALIPMRHLLEMKRSANRLKDLADLEALEKIAPYKK